MFKYGVRMAHCVGCSTDGACHLQFPTICTMFPTRDWPPSLRDNHASALDSGARAMYPKERYSMFKSVFLHDM